MYTISVVELIKLVDPIIIDVRNYYYYSIEHIDGAISIPYYNLLNNHSHYLNKHNRYYMYCEKGDRSIGIVKRLNSFGYDTISVDGGYEEYKKVLNLS